MGVNGCRLAWRIPLCVGALIGMAGPAAADPPTAPANMFVRAEAATGTSQISVTWADLSGESFYEILRHASPSPGPMLVTQAGAPALGPGWERVGRADQNATSFVHGTVAAGTYALCGTASSGEIACFGPSGFAAPRLPEGNATVDSLQVFLRAVDRLGVQWTSSANTVSARVTLKRAGATVDERTETDPAATAIFNGLQPNTPHEIAVCVRNADQTAQTATCRSVRASTLPRVPGGVESIRVVPTILPTEAALAIVHDNEAESAVRGLQVNLIQDDAILSSQTVRPDQAGRATHTVRFTNLAPFTGYEAWVVPFNESGVGTAAGIGFTTPEAVRPIPEPISADSVMLRWTERAPGTYALERLDGTVWTEMASYRSLQPGARAVVLDGADAARTVRLTWRLASLRSASAAVSPEPLGPGAPELISTQRSFRATGQPRQLRMRHAVTFRATRGGQGAYELERNTAQGWRVVDGSRTVGITPNNAVRTIADENRPADLAPAPQEAVYRVCRVSRGRGGTEVRACSAPSGFASFGIPRVE